jgi:alkylhydroperoxidase family enzyme
VPRRDYELLALRSAWRCRCAYVFAQHRSKATTLEVLSVDEVDRVAGELDAGAWLDWDLNLLGAADELHDDGCLSDPTWSMLQTRYDEAQLVEVPLIVGAYHTLAFAMNSFGVQLEPGAIAFGPVV